MSNYFNSIDVPWVAFGQQHEVSDAVVNVP